MSMSMSVSITFLILFRDVADSTNIGPSASAPDRPAEPPSYEETMRQLSFNPQHSVKILLQLECKTMLYTSML